MNYIGQDKKERKLVATGGQYKGAQFTIGESILMGCSGEQCHVIFGADVSGVSDVQCIVSPANSFGLMDGGYDIGIMQMRWNCYRKLILLRKE